MTSVYFDGNLKRIYEVPTNSTFTVDGSGYRVYTPTGTGEDPSRLDFQRDIWSRFQDYFHINPWSTIAVSRSGGNLRGQDQEGNDIFQTNDFTLQTDIGWRLVLADYDHEAIIEGNLFAVAGSPQLFDNSRLTARAYPRISAADSFLSYSYSSGSGLNNTQDTRIAEVWATLASPGVFSTAALANAPGGSAGSTPADIYSYFIADSRADAFKATVDLSAVALDADVKSCLALLNADEQIRSGRYKKLTAGTNTVILDKDVADLGDGEFDVTEHAP